MAKLHELLAVEGDLKGAYGKILNETINTFTKKESHFMGGVRTLHLFDSEAVPLAPDVQEMVTTVPDKLDYQAKHIIRYLDAVYQKEATNQVAQADLIVEGQTIARAVPATVLLGLESQLKTIRKTYERIPTLAPGVKWVADPEKGKYVYRNENPEEAYKSEKVTEPVVLYEATKEHPAQVKEAVKTVNVGKYQRTIWSGMITPAQKSELLSRIDKLIRSVKRARQRANRVEIVKGKIGKSLIDYIHDGKG